MHNVDNPNSHRPFLQVTTHSQKLKTTMKKITAFVVLLTVISTATFASLGPLGENSKFTVLSKSDVKYELVYVSDVPGDVIVTIYDQEDRNIVSNTVKEATKFRRTYDFANMAPGNYRVVVKNKEGIGNEEIAHLVKKAKLQTFSTKIPDAQAVKVHVGDFNNKVPVHIKIYDTNNRIVHKEAIENIQSFSKVFDLSKLGLDDVLVTVENDGEMKQFSLALKD